MKVLTLITCLLVFFLIADAQEWANELDTLTTYDVSLDSRMTTYGRIYMVNGKDVKKEEYERFKNHWNVEEKCRPCILYTYDGSKNLKYVSYQYMDCMFGEYKSFYPDGSLKSHGFFRDNPGNDWSNLRLRNLCSVREGEWRYYNPAGKLELTEYYRSGALERTENADSGEREGIKKLKGFFKQRED